jgi:hypothetical protein
MEKHQNYDAIFLEYWQVFLVSTKSDFTMPTCTYSWCSSHLITSSTSLHQLHRYNFHTVGAWIDSPDNCCYPIYLIHHIRQQSWYTWTGSCPITPELVPVLVHRNWFLSYYTGTGSCPGTPELVPVLVHRNQFLSWYTGTGSCSGTPELVPVLVHLNWFLVHLNWFLVHLNWSLVHLNWSWYTWTGSCPGTPELVPGTPELVPGTVHINWFLMSQTPDLSSLLILVQSDLSPWHFDIAPH